MSRSLPTEIDVLLAEYNEMYRLVEFRLAALDRRVPMLGAALFTFVGSIPFLPQISQMLVLFAVPFSCVWFVRTTLNHARSFEDVIRRIEQIERAISDRLGVPLLGFQSSHPSRGTHVGGRTSSVTAEAALVASALLLGSCLTISLSVVDLSSDWTVAYACLVSAISLHLGAAVHRWSRYRYLSE